MEEPDLRELVEAARMSKALAAGTGEEPKQEEEDAEESVIVQSRNKMSPSEIASDN